MSCLLHVDGPQVQGRHRCCVPCTFPDSSLDECRCIGDAVEVAVGALAGADAAACDLDRRALEDASELYLVLDGSLPPTQSALVEAQILREPSARFEITAEGVIVPGPGSPCV